MNTELVRVVAEDLSYLPKAFPSNPDLSHVRREAALLRRLLHQGDFEKAWRELGLGGRPTIRASDIDDYLRRQGSRRIAFVQAGDGNFHGRGWEIEIGERPARSEEHVGPQDRSFLIPDYLAGTCLVWNGIRVSRHSVLMYVANKAGSAHFDTGRPPRGKVAVQYHAIDAMYRLKMGTGPKNTMNPVFYQLLSIAQALANSDSARTFLKAAASAAAHAGHKAPNPH